MVHLIEGNIEDKTLPLYRLLPINPFKVRKKNIRFCKRCLTYIFTSTQLNKLYTKDKKKAKVLLREVGLHYFKPGDVRILPVYDDHGKKVILLSIASLRTFNKNVDALSTSISMLKHRYADNGVTNISAELKDFLDIGFTLKEFKENVEKPLSELIIDLYVYTGSEKLYKQYKKLK
jgi:hypothetical protein